METPSWLPETRSNSGSGGGGFLGPLCGRPGGHVGALAFLGPPPPRGLAERQPLGVSLGPNISGSEGQGGPATALPAPGSPGLGVGVGRPRRRWRGNQLLGARGEGASGLHFPGGPARDRKCPEPLNGRRGLARLFRAVVPGACGVRGFLSQFTGDPRERPPGGRGGSRRPQTPLRPTVVRG